MHKMQLGCEGAAAAAAAGFAAGSVGKIRAGFFSMLAAAAAIVRTDAHCKASSSAYILLRNT